MASQLLEPRGKEQEERRGEVKTAEEKNGGEKESVFFLGRFPAARF